MTKRHISNVLSCSSQYLLFFGGQVAYFQHVFLLLGIFALPVVWMTKALVTIRCGDSVTAIHCPRLAGQWLDRIFHRSHGRQHDQQANIPHWSPYSTDNSSAGRWTDVSGTSSNEETQRSTDYGTDYGTGMSKAKEKQQATKSRTRQKPRHRYQGTGVIEPNNQSPGNASDESHEGTGVIQPNGESPVNEGDPSLGGIGEIKPNDESPVDAGDVTLEEIGDKSAANAAALGDPYDESLENAFGKSHEMEKPVDAQLAQSSPNESTCCTSRRVVTEETRLVVNEWRQSGVNEGNRPQLHKAFANLVLAGQNQQADEIMVSLQQYYG